MQTRVHAQSITDIDTLGTDTTRPALGFIDVLFLLSALLASVELRLVASFTVYDLLMIGIALLIMVGPRRMHFLPFRYLLAIYIFFLFAIISTFRAPFPEESITQILQFAYIFFIQLPVILTVLQSQRMQRWTLIFFLLGLLVIPVWAFIFQETQGADRVVVYISKNPNRLGYPTTYGLPLVLYFMFDAWQRKRSLLAIVLGLPICYLLIWALGASASRSAALGVLVSLIVFLVFRHGFAINLRMLVRLLLTVAVVGGVGLFLYQSDYFPVTLRERTERMMASDGNLIEDRTLLFTAGWRAFLESPFVGVGFDNFRYVSKKYLLTASKQVPHNIWIQFLSQIGLIGTLMFLILILLWYWDLFWAQHKIQNHSQRECIWALIAAMAAIMTIHLFVPLMIQRQYWLLYGVGLAIALNVRESQVHLGKNYPHAISLVLQEKSA